MNRHLALVSDVELQNILSGKLPYLIKFFKKRLDFLNTLQKGDLIYLRKKGGEVLGQFNIGKLIEIERLEIGDWKFIKDLETGLKKEDFEEKIEEHSVMVIVQIEKLEQFITSPIDTPKSKKEWVVLE